MNVIEVNNVSKKFRLGASSGDLRERVSSLFTRKSREEEAARDFWALQDISFNVAQGESFGIIGHNGSGKSTLLKLLTGIYKPTSGTFKTHGRISALIEVGAGFHPDLTGRENVYLNGSVLGLKRREIDRLLNEIVAFSELEQFIDTPVKRYSSGMYMRLGFAVAAHVDPDIVLVDEVLSVGDESFQKKCMAKMLDLRKQGKTIVFISHSMEAVTELCQRVMLLSHGELIGVGGPGEMFSIYRATVAKEQLRGASKNMPPSTTAVADREYHKMEIISVKLLDKYGEECESIEVGDPLVLECHYQAHEQIERPAFGIMVHRADNLYIHGFNSKFDGFFVPCHLGENVFRVTFNGLNLLQGIYHFRVLLLEIHPDNSHTEVDSFAKAVDLAITGNIMDHGMMVLPHVWGCEEFVEAQPPKCLINA